MGAGEAVPRAGDGWPLRPTLVRCAARCGRGHGRRVCDRRGVGLGEPLGALRIRLEPEGDFARVRVLHACRPTCSGRCSPPGATSGPCGRTCGGKSCDAQIVGAFLRWLLAGRCWRYCPIRRGDRFRPRPCSVPALGIGNLLSPDVTR